MTSKRNAQVNDLNPLELRQDTSALWKNFIISEMIKFLRNNGFDKNMYFRRTLQKQEIDYIEPAAGKLSAFEIKWKKNKFKPSRLLIQNYPPADTPLISSENYNIYNILQ